MISEKLLILNYHKIEPERDIGLTTRHPDDFYQDLSDLSIMGYKTITFKDILTNNIPEKPVMLTFDDSYRSFFNNGYSQLLKFNMKAIVYVPVKYIGKFNSWDVQIGKKRYLHMDEEQLKEISSNDIEIGSHGMTHRFLSFCSQKDLDFELRESSEKLKKITSQEIVSFSYPFGKYNAHILSQAQKYYSFGVALVSFNNGYLDRMALPRINIYRTDSRKSFRKKLDYFNNKSILLKNWLIQQGGWATIALQRLRMV